MTENEKPAAANILMAAPPEPTVMPLSELEVGLLEKFKKEKSIRIEDMNNKETGALGKLAARKLVERFTEPVGDGPKKKAVWRLKE